LEIPTAGSAELKKLIEGKLGEMEVTQRTSRSLYGRVSMGFMSAYKMLMVLSWR